MESIWKKMSKKIPLARLEERKKTDVLIIGGGIAGILCAYHLQNAGVDCLLVEEGEICGKVTGNTTAKITVQHGAMYGDMIKRFGEEKARLYAEAQIRALDEYERLSKSIDCDFEKQDSYVYSIHDRKKMGREANACKRLGIRGEFADTLDIPVKIAGAVCVKDQAQFHPLKLLYQLASRLPILERTKVLELLPHKVRTHHGEISFQKLIVATHFPMLNKHGLYFLKLYQHRSYVLALKNAQRVNGMYVDEADTGLSFRNYGDLLLLGGGGHRTGKQGGCWKELETFAKKHYPNAQIVGKWATQDCMTLDGIPYIGRYSKSTPDLFVATGFNKWGMTNAMVSANILCDLVQEKPNRYAEVFSPSRSMLRPQLAFNALESAVGLLTPTAPRCPHLGCALKYNTAEHSWDCSCHGSRFDDHGKLLDGPATDDLPSGRSQVR